MLVGFLKRSKRAAGRVKASSHKPACNSSKVSVAIDEFNSKRRRMGDDRYSLNVSRARTCRLYILGNMWRGFGALNQK